jgi:PEGA domain-containing protein
LLSNACATIAHGPLAAGRSQQTVIVESTPGGARVLVGGAVVGLTPTRLVVNRSDRHLTLRLEKDGYRPADVLLATGVSPWIAGDVVIGIAQFANQGLSSGAAQARAAVILPPVFLAVDFLTGAAFRHPARVHVTLEPSGEAYK